MLTRRALTILLILTTCQLTAHAEDGKLEPRQQTVVISHKAIGDTPIIGPRFAPVTVDFFIRFSDTYYTKRILANLRLLAKRHPSRMRIVFRPTERISYSYWFYAESAMEAYAQGKFFKFMDAMHKERRRPNRKKVSAVARSVGMDVDRLEKALTTRRHKAAMEANYNYYMQRFNTSYPQEPLLFNGKKPRRTNSRYRYRRRYSSSWDSKYMSLDEFENTYDEAYARGKALLHRGVPLHKLYRATIADLDAKKPPLKVSRGYIDNQPRNWHRKKTALRPLRGKVDLSGPHSRGPKHAPVTVAFYCSFNGSRCQGMKTRIIDPLLKAYPKQVRIVFKHLFDKNYNGTSSYYRRKWYNPRKLHEGSLCADAQGAFWRFYDILWKNSYRYRYRKPRDAEMSRHAKQAQLDVKKFDQCMKTGSQAKRLDRMVKRARKANVVHTPSIIIGGRLYEGSKTTHEIMSLVRQELAPGWLRTRWPSEDDDE